MAHLSQTRLDMRPGGAALFATLRGMWAVHHQRRSLLRLDDRALRDIGLTRDAARAESRRPFWDIPAAQLGKRC